MDETNLKFWDYSFETVADYDLPASIDFILEKTKQRKLSYIAYSVAATEMFAGMSTDPDYYKERINLFIAISPIVKTQHIISPTLRMISALGDFMFTLITNHGPEVSPKPNIDNKLVKIIMKISNLDDVAYDQISD